MVERRRREGGVKKGEAKRVRGVNSVGASVGGWGWGGESEKGVNGGGSYWR